MSNHLSVSDFINELNDLCHKHSVYVAHVEGQDSLSILPIEQHMNSAGYVNQGDSGQIDFDWH